MAALGTWVGWSSILWTGLYGAVAGGVLAIGVGLSHGYLRQAFTNIGGLLLFWSVQGIKPLPQLTLEHGRGPRLPYALPIFAGLVTTLWTTLKRTRRWGSERGAELIEMVVVTPLLLLLALRHHRLRLPVPALRRVDQRRHGRARAWGFFPATRAADAQTRATTYAATGGVAGAVTAVATAVNLPASRRSTWPGIQVTVTHIYIFRLHRPDRRASSAGRFTSVTLTASVHDAPATRHLGHLRFHVTKHTHDSSFSCCPWWSPAPRASWCSGRCRAFRFGKSKCEATRWLLPPRPCRWAACSPPRT